MNCIGNSSGVTSSFQSYFQSKSSVAAVAIPVILTLVVVILLYRYRNSWTKNGKTTTAAITGATMLPTGAAATNYYRFKRHKKNRQEESFQKVVEKPRRIENAVAADSKSDVKIEEKETSKEDLIAYYRSEDYYKQDHREQLSEAFEEHNKCFYALSTQNPERGFFQKYEVSIGDRIFVQKGLHGDSKSLLNLLDDLRDEGHIDNQLLCKEGVYLVFLGDFCSKGASNLVVLEILSQLRRKNPNQVFLTRGLIEDPKRFDPQLEAFVQLDSTGQNMSRITRFFDTLPLGLYLGTSKGHFYYFTNDYCQLEPPLGEVFSSPHCFDTRREYLGPIFEVNEGYLSAKRAENASLVTVCETDEWEIEELG